MVFLKKYKYIISAIILAVIRFVMNIYDLDVIPNGLNADEAANGYDAYLIAETGKDLQNKSFPLFFFHITDYVEPIYIYLSSIFVSIFGANPFSYRLLAAVVGASTVLTTFLLGRQIFNQKIGLIAALLLVVSPWHFVFSRIAFRGILMPFFSSLSLLYLFKSLNDKKYLIHTGIYFGILFYTYSIAKAFIPLILISFLIIYFSEIKNTLKSNDKKYLIWFTIFISAFAFPTYYFSFFMDGNVRFKGMSVFDSENSLSFFLENMGKHLSIFITGGSIRNPGHEIDKTDFVYWSYFMFFIASLVLFFKNISRHKVFLIFIFIIALIPASLTSRGIPHILRTICVFPIFEIITAFSIYKIYLSLKNRPIISNLYALAIVGLISFNFLLMTFFYFKYYRVNSAKWFDRTLIDNCLEIKRNQEKFDHILFYGKDYLPYKPLVFTCFDVTPIDAQTNNKEFKIQLNNKLIIPQNWNKDNILTYNLMTHKIETIINHD